MKREKLEGKINERLTQLPGKAAILAKDLQTGEIFQWNEDVLMTPASTIKLPILCAAYYWASRGLVSLEQRFSIKEEDRVGGNGVLFELAAGLQPTLQDLMILMIVLSDNMATNLLMETIGTEHIKEFLEAKGLGTIRAERKMLDGAGMKQGLVNCVTAKALGQLLEGLVSETLLDSADCKHALDLLKRQQCNNKMPVKIIERWDLVFKRNPIQIAHKTGDMPGIEHDVGLIFTPKTTILLVILTEDTDNDQAIGFIQDIAKEFVGYFS